MGWVSVLCMLRAGRVVIVSVCCQALATSAGALFTSADGAGSSTDLAVKIREDPLFLIRKKEEDAKKLLASNPVKMKQLQQVCPIGVVHILVLAKPL